MMVSLRWSAQGSPLQGAALMLVAPLVASVLPPFRRSRNEF
jgi:hypothetical protein